MGFSRGRRKLGAGSSTTRPTSAASEGREKSRPTRDCVMRVARVAQAPALSLANSAASMGLGS